MAIGGIRASLWDQRQPVEATALYAHGCVRGDENPGAPDRGPEAPEGPENRPDFQNPTKLTISASFSRAFFDAPRGFQKTARRAYDSHLSLGP